MAQIKEKKTIFWIIEHVHSRIAALIVMLVSYVGSAILGVAFALASSRVVDTAVAENREGFLNACIAQLAVIVGIILCLTICRHLKDRLTADLDRDWKKNILHKLLHGEYETVSGYHSGDLLNRMNNDVRILDDGIVTIIPDTASMIVRLVAAIGVLAVLDIRFTLCLVAVGLILNIVTGLMRGKLKGLNKKVSEHEGKVLGFIQETLENLLVVQAMDIPDEMERRSAVLMEGRYQVQRRRKNVTLFANTAISIMSYAATFIALVWCSASVMNHEMTFGTLVAVTQLVAQLRAPLVNMSGILPRYAAMTAAAERIMELECVVPKEEPENINVKSTYETMKAIKGEGLTFSYDREEILANASFILPKGKFITITGASGAGKSTLLKLLLGIYRPDSGGMYIECENDEKNLSRSTRGLFAYVPQKNLLFSGTLKDNLTVVKPEASTEEIEHAVYASCMDEYLQQLPEALDTVIGENTMGLSEGQAQRLAIARAILGGAPILLLDECTSALDPMTERKVLEHIKELPNRTCIVVTHRPAAIEICDIKVDISDGKIATNNLNL